MAQVRCRARRVVIPRVNHPVLSCVGPLPRVLVQWMQDRKALGGFVGFANLPNQVHRRSVKKGFRFTLLVVGEGGLGKATLVNTLFGTQIIPPRAPLSANEPAPTAVSIKSHTAGACCRPGR